MRAIISGDRSWNDQEAVESVFSVLELLNNKHGKENVTIIHGWAKGIDTIADVLAKLYGMNVEGYPADWNTYKRAAGPIRNKQMLDTGVHEVYGFHRQIESSKGTRDMLNISFKKDIPVFIHNGLVLEEYSRG